MKRNKLTEGWTDQKLALEILKTAYMEEEDEALFFALGYAVKHLKEVRVGHWVESKDYDEYGDPYIYCSICKECQEWNGTYKTKYCPNCGAKMEAE